MTTHENREAREFAAARRRRISRRGLLAGAGVAFATIGAATIGSSVSPTVAAAPPRQASPEASPAASPVATPGAGDDPVTITSHDIFFDPREVTIPANTDVTLHLPNRGMITHNFSVTDRKNPNVPDLDIVIDLPPGAIETTTINAPAGDYYFYCNIPGHEAAGMFGTLHVV